MSTYQTRIAVYEGRDRADGDAGLSAYAALYGKVQRKLFSDVAAGRSAASLKNAYLEPVRDTGADVQRGAGVAGRQGVGGAGVSEPVCNLLRISVAKASTTICRLVLSFLSQFFQSRRHFSSQANDRSTTHRFGSTTKVCSSLRFTHFHRGS